MNVTDELMDQKKYQRRIVIDNTKEDILLALAKGPMSQKDLADIVGFDYRDEIFTVALWELTDPGIIFLNNEFLVELTK